MNYAIVEFPTKPDTDNTFRVAKLNNTTKRPVIVAYFNKALEELRKLVSDVTSKVEEKVTSGDMSNLNQYLSVLDRLQMTIKDVIEIANTLSFRKLKVNSLVQNKVLNIFDHVEREKEELPKEEVSFNYHSMDENREMANPNIFSLREEKTNVEMPIETKEEVQETRVNRYEQETPFYQNFERRMDNYPKVESPTNLERNMGRVLNFPSRSERNYDERNAYMNSVNTLVNEDNNSNAYKNTLNVGEGSKNLDKINDRINDKSSNISENHNTVEDLQRAYDDFSSTEKRKKDAIDEVLNLEKQVREAKDKLKKQLAERKEKIANLYEKTNANRREIEDYTLHSRDLRQQLDELLKQINDNSEDYGERSRGMRRAA